MKKKLFICISFVCSLITTGMFAQERDSIKVCQPISDSFTKLGIPDVFVTLCDTNGIMIDTLRTFTILGFVKPAGRKRLLEECSHL